MTRPERAGRQAAFKVLIFGAATAVLLGGAEIQSALRAIQASDLRGDLSFLASDALQGRYTPSPGLDVAAEFIASQFREAGLAPGGNQDYFQLASMVDRRVPAPSDMTVQEGAKSWTVPSASLSVAQSNFAASVDHAPVLVLGARDPDLLKGLDLSGKAVVVMARPVGKIAPGEMQSFYNKRLAFDKAIASSAAAVEIVVAERAGGPGRARLLSAEEAQEHRPPVVTAASDELMKWVEHPDASGENRTITLNVPAPEDQKVLLKNVIGVLRGSDPKLKDTYVLLTAHYDHIGTGETGKEMSPNRAQNPNDQIYNGANDDGSGTVSVIEIAKAMAKANLHPKRSIVFMTFFGEERGDIGSGYYGAHPVFPIAKTVADVNLEQVGRTDSTLGPHVHDASVTGFDYSDVTKYLQAAGRATGIKVYLEKDASDAYFARSDNAALALRGVPAHTLCVAFDYPDYHGVGDEWQKIDYDNMAQVDRMVSLALWNIANSATAPNWDSHNPKTLPFRQAQGEIAQP